MKKQGKSSHESEEEVEEAFGKASEHSDEELTERDCMNGDDGDQVGSGAKRGGEYTEESGEHSVGEGYLQEDGDEDEDTALLGECSDMNCWCLMSRIFIFLDRQGPGV